MSTNNRKGNEVQQCYIIVQSLFSGNIIFLVNSIKKEFTTKIKRKLSSSNCEKFIF